MKVASIAYHKILCMPVDVTDNIDNIMFWCQCFNETYTTKYTLLSFTYERGILIANTILTDVWFLILGTVEK